MLKQRGITHIVAYDSDYGAGDLRAHAAEWGIAQLFEYGGLTLYRID